MMRRKHHHGVGRLEADRLRRADAQKRIAAIEVELARVIAEQIQRGHGYTAHDDARIDRLYKARSRLERVVTDED